MNTKALYTSTEFAKYLTAKAKEKGLDMNMTKLQKLLYVSYGLYLAFHGQRLFDEHPQAWPYGPVFPTTRNKIKKLNINSISLENITNTDLKSDEKINKLLDIVFNTFGKRTASWLSNWSHMEGSPWSSTKNKTDFKWGNRIDDDLIKTYFKKIIS